jgi:hypothetical protein
MTRSMIIRAGDRRLAPDCKHAPSVFPALRDGSSGRRGNRAIDRSWYNRAGVARHGLLHGRTVQGILPSVPEFERMLVRSGIVPAEYWFSITDEVRQFVS